MQLIADLHLHSKYSRAVSQKMDILEIARWAQNKGINLVATGDWTHPLWVREIKANLEENGTGLLRLKEKAAEVAHENLRGPLLARDETQVVHNLSGAVSEATSANFVGSPPPLFLLSTEISSIYTQGGKQRRIHNLVLAPSIAVVEKINQELVRKGANLTSDGRPIIGLSAKDLTELVLGVDQRCLIICAHIWTPWFSLFGSMSGFDSLEECFGKMSNYIYAIETGLSSDAAMNWRVKELDNRAILSFSDAHSGPKLGREATVFELERLNFTNLRRAIITREKWEVGDEKWDVEVRSESNKSENSKIQKFKNSISKKSHFPHLTSRILYTVEFYPEEGKYHYTGHRNCQVRQSPEETKKLGKICPSCGKLLTVGVMHRVEQLATRALSTEDLITKKDESGVRWISFKNRPPYVTLVPLLEILGEALGSMPTSLKILTEYNNLTANLGGEFGVLLRVSIEEIAKIAGQKVAQGIKKVRSGDIVVEPGYDGVFGKVKIWPSFAKASERESEKKQLSLFA